MSRRCSVRFSLQRSSFVRSFSVSFQAPSFVRCFCISFFASPECVAVTACCITTTLRTYAHAHARRISIHSHALTYVFVIPRLSSISASFSYHLPLCVLDTHARAAPLYFRLSQNNLPSSSPSSSSSSSFCTRLHRWLWIATISACLYAQKHRFRGRGLLWSVMFPPPGSGVRGQDQAGALKPKERWQT
jgi:hypothetical protein